MAPDPKAYRDTIGLFATGVAVIAVRAGDEVQAMTANAVSSLSLEPMRLLFCPGKLARFARLLVPGLAFSVNVLGSEQQALSSYFAGGWKQAAPPPFRFLPLGNAPRLEGSLAAIGCVVEQLIDGGDHWIVIGAVCDLHAGAGLQRPLVFFGGRYHEIDREVGARAPDLATVGSSAESLPQDAGG
ncbi:MAG: flavin reductase family protein [Gammaproteobacteria bacterium]|nr:flavin reductase family protein [Gammaproteobacteria bacterium]